MSISFPLPSPIVILILILIPISLYQPFTKQHCLNYSPLWNIQSSTQHVSTYVFPNITNIHSCLKYFYNKKYNAKYNSNLL